MSLLEKNIDNYDEDKVLPFEFTETIMFSSDLDIESKVQKEIIPREQSSFGQQTHANLVSSDTLNSRLTFYISDPRHYLDMADSYFTCDFRACATTDPSVANYTALKACLSVGGIHAFIKTLVIKIGGTQLMRLDDYNKWYNINNLSTHSEDYTDFMLGCSGDSVASFHTGIPENELRDADGINLWDIPGLDQAATNLTAAGLIDDLASANFAAVGAEVRRRVRVGDMVRINDQYGRVSAIGAFTNNASSTITLSGGAFTVIAAAAVTELYNYSRLPTRSLLVNSGLGVGNVFNNAVAQFPYQKLQWQLPVGALRFLKYFPLPYVQEVGPLEIEFEFIDAVQGLIIDAATNATHGFGYQISRPRFVASMIRPSDKVFKAHDMLYNSKGIWMPYLNYRHFRNRLDANTVDSVLTIQTNLSSVRHALSVMVDATRADSSSQTTQDYESQASFLKSFLQSYRFSAGGEQFPEYAPVDCVSRLSGEAWAQLMLSFNIKENTIMKTRIRPYEWQSPASDKFIISTNFAKDNSLWNGLSLKNNFLELDIRKLAQNLAINVHTYLGYDSALLISRKDNVRVFD